LPSEKEEKILNIPNRTEEVRDIIERMPVTFAKYVTHAGIVNPDGTYDAKGGGSQYYIRTGMTENEFFTPYPPVIDPVTNESSQLTYRPDDMERIVYYRLR
jgi:hypothetical protein